MLQSLLIFSCLLLAVTGQDIDCSQDSDCPDDKPYCNNVGQCSWCMPPDYPPPFEDCKYFVDLNGWPYFLPHKYNCSRFWECEVNYDVCLFECPSCGNPGDPGCPTGALFFDESIQYPYGPVCNWPAVINCTDTKPPDNNCTLPCQHMDENFVCQPECCQDSDCLAGKPLCNAEGICTEGCRDDQDCDNWNGMCPGCQWCDKPSNVEIGQCKPGCLTDDQCGPSQQCVEHICKDHCLLPCQTVVNGECQPECCQDSDCPTEKPLCNADGICKDGCRDDQDCDNWNGMCPGCQWCDKPSNVEIGQCKPGCLTDDQCGPNQNCVDHICVCPLPCQNFTNGACQPECCQDSDCPTGKPLCNADGICTDGCRKGSECAGYDRPCHEPWQQGDDNCEYCDNVDTSEEIGQCQPGCDDTHDMCPGSHVCDGKHSCVSDGVTLIKKIHLTTASCAQCNTAPSQEGGAKLHIESVHQSCLTKGLDRAASVDYAAGTTADFASSTDPDVMGTCNNAEIGPSGPKTTTIEWTGDGTWTPRAIKLEVTGGYLFGCELPSPPPSLSSSDSPVLLNCELE